MGEVRGEQFTVPSLLLREGPTFFSSFPFFFFLRRLAEQKKDRVSRGTPPPFSFASTCLCLSVSLALSLISSLWDKPSAGSFCVFFCSLMFPLPSPFFLLFPSLKRQRRREGKGEEVSSPGHLALLSFLSFENFLAFLFFPFFLFFMKQEERCRWGKRTDPPSFSNFPSFFPPSFSPPKSSVVGKTNGMSRSFPSPSPSPFFFFTTTARQARVVFSFFFFSRLPPSLSFFFFLFFFPPLPSRTAPAKTSGEGTLFPPLLRLFPSFPLPPLSEKTERKGPDTAAMPRSPRSFFFPLPCGDGDHPHPPSPPPPFSQTRKR